MTKETHRFKIGQFDCAVITDGLVPLTDFSPGTGIFPDVPADELIAAMEAAHYPRTSSHNCLLVQTGQDVLICDTGNGDAAQPNFGHLPDNLRVEGVSPEDVTVVFITHCHPDHINGLTDGDGNLVFRNARYVASKVDWEHWMKDETFADLPDFQAEGFRKNLLPIKNNVTLIEDGEDIIDGVKGLAAFGHSPGHMAVWVESDGETLLHLADTANAVIQVEHPDWCARFDFDSSVSPVSRRKIYGLAADTGTLTMAYHFPFPGVGAYCPRK